jgi:hypothetical protein
LFFCVILQISKELNIDEASQSTMNRLKRKFHLNFNVQKRGSTFTKCIVCESLKDLISKVGKNNASANEHELKLKRHNKHQKSSRCLYHSWKKKVHSIKRGVLCIIHNKMDHPKTIILRLQVKKKWFLGLASC